MIIRKASKIGYRSLESLPTVSSSTERLRVQAHSTVAKLDIKNLSKNPLASCSAYGPLRPTGHSLECPIPSPTCQTLRRQMLHSTDRGQAVAELAGCLSFNRIASLSCPINKLYDGSMYS